MTVNVNRLQSVGQGSGMFGSIKASDLKGGAPASKAVGGAQSSAPYTDIPVTNIRGVIAKRLLQSKQVIL